MTNEQIRCAVLEVLEQWRPGMSAEVKNHLAEKIAERIVRNSDND